MRWIIADDVEDELPANWADLVDEAVNFVQQEGQKARDAALAEGKPQQEVEEAFLGAVHKAVGKRARVWAKASDALASASNDKCWYCEKRQGRSDMPVDHFRPKGRVHEAGNHSGYWWLAFDWRNLRLSCTYCNSRRRDVKTGKVGGKQDYFPIFEPPLRQACATDPNDRPALLDPTVDGDARLLTFLLNGFPSPTSAEKEHDDHNRALRSIELYHLDHTTLVRERKELARHIRQLVEEGQKADQEGDQEGRRAKKKELLKLARRQAELSSAARVYLGAFRNIAWVQEIFDRDL
jgi:uncharacterized protein (TIGR02646 family)